MENLPIPRVILNNGIPIPALGFGTWKATGKEVINAVTWALESGYRLIDTATYYDNEREIGISLKKSGIAREDLFLATKVWKTDQGYEQTLKAFNRSLQALQVSYLDLYLIHWPHPRTRKATWKALEHLYEQKKVRSIGVCNYTVFHLEELLTDCKIIPTVDQIEFHPFQFEKATMDFCASKKIQLEAYSPLVQSNKMNHPLIQSLSINYRKTPAQILLRWGLQHNAIPLPKSVTKSRINENRQVFDFNILPEDMNQLDNIGEEFRSVEWDPKTAYWR
jgi:diketogulonate reductase-like aldo/keto reductase